MEAIAGYKQLELDNFSREEVQNLLSYYKKNNWITKGWVVQCVVCREDLES